MTVAEDLQQDSVLCLSGVIGTAAEGEVLRRVEAVLSRGVRHIVLNIANVTRVDAAGLGQLVQASNLARAARAELRVVGAAERIRSLFERTGLVPVLRVSSHSACPGVAC
jgi:anti-anti-sigma factor